ncbi:hypothetical protein PhCBS80983_g01620 [Powellomyces hirtus]|uniref:Polysaccharide lyase 14 domain-containing protein n=1 Tax=Powellomyces hirtus TaxID=109895 RepID=A0A507EBY6_9FUNG|nr:hypothetical protein PhCBS80983_g01620 [Powellomyces hirtus]
MSACNINGAVAPTVCDEDIGCGAGCQYACPFGFPCNAPSDCLSGACSAGFCDTGKGKSSQKSSKPSSSSWEMTTFHDGLEPINIVKTSYGEDNREIVPDPAGSGDKVLRVTYPAGSYNPSGKPRGGTGFYAQPVDLSHATAVSFEVQMFFPKGFDFVKGGKLPGLYGGRMSCSGGDPAKDCFSTRYMFRKKGAGEIYLYVNADDQVDAFCEIPPLTVCNGAYGNSIGRGAFTFKTGVWQSLLQRITLNTPGKNNGRVQVFHNGVEVIDFDQVSWRDSSSVTFEGIEFETFFGGADSSWATPRDQFIYFKGMSMHWE